MAPHAVVIGLGAGLPKRVVSNNELPEHLDTSDEWIRERTGIRQRYLAGEDETTASLATLAARQALEDAGIDADALDLIIVSTSTPDTTMPSTACMVQSNLGNHGAAAFDLNAACSGFVYGLQMAYAQIQSGLAKRAMVIGAETMSRIVDWDDRRTCVLFGDGAAAMILEAQENSNRGILGCQVAADGSFGDILGTDGGVSSTQTAGHLHMEGKEVFRHAVDKMASAASDMLTEVGLTLDDVDWIVPHQANARIIQSIAKRMKIKQGRFIMTLDQHANTSAASIPLALCDAKANDLLQRENIIALPALGAGLTWGCCIIRW